MVVGAYVCNNPECGHIDHTYRRDCPNCGEEKSLYFDGTVLLRCLILNMATSITPEALQSLADISGCGKTTHTDLFNEIQNI